MSIKVEHISKSYGSQLALSDVSFAVEPGEVVGFLGPNGAGKSTMMKILTGYLNPDDGKFEVAGLDGFREMPAIQKRLGYLPEHNPLYDSMYVREYLSFTAGMYHGAKSRVEEVIEQVGLGAMANKKIHQLSKGYQQRVGLAQALVHDPDVLILDEPTTGLDPNQIVEIRDLIRSVSASKTILLSTHIMQEVEALCSRVLILRDGSLVADRPVDGAADGEMPQVLLLEFEGELDLNAFKKKIGAAAIEVVSEQQWLVSAPKGRDLRKVIFQSAVEGGWNILQLQVQKASMEDVFRSLTQKPNS
jgi:ABC-2 type transport system ATP-binding protein